MKKRRDFYQEKRRRTPRNGSCFALTSREWKQRIARRAKAGSRMPLAYVVWRVGVEVGWGGWFGCLRKITAFLRLAAQAERSVEEKGALWLWEWDRRSVAESIEVNQCSEGEMTSRLSKGSLKPRFCHQWRNWVLMHSINKNKSPKKNNWFHP